MRSFQAGIDQLSRPYFRKAFTAIVLTTAMFLTCREAYGWIAAAATTALSQGPIARLPTAVTIVTTPAAFTIAPPFIKATPSISWCADSSRGS